MLESYGGGPIIIKKTALELMTPCHCICQPPHTVEVIKVKVNRWKVTHLPVKVFSAKTSSVHEVKKERPLVMLLDPHHLPDRGKIHFYTRKSGRTF